jgi:dipeptidyl aminopeptidase/acylaminoacyl peptidase
MRPSNAAAPDPVPWEPWPSPVTPALLATGSLGFSELQVDGDAVFWLELRAAERGRRALVRWTPDGGAADVLPPTADVGTKVHEYGGGGYRAAGGLVVFAERGDGSVWLLAGAGPPRAIVRVPGCRYADFEIDVRRGRVYAVRKDHRERPPTDPANAIVALDLDPADPAANAGRVVFGASDFVSTPRRSPDGTRLAFLSWNHPNMPWDATTLHVASLETDGSAAVVAGGPEESIAGPAWSPDGALLFASDRTGWWNLYAARDGATHALAPVEAECAEPAWVFGRPPFVALGADRAIGILIRDGRIGAAAFGEGTVTPLAIGPVDGTPLPYGPGLVYVATPVDAPAAIRLARTAGDPAPRTLRAASTLALDPADVSIPEQLTLPTADGETTHVTFFPPRNARVAGGDPPPLLVMSHGGPTAMYAPAYDPSIAYWTTRGVAVAHVNYRGSTGFGRAYRRRLDGAWGVVDVIDCVSAARALAASGRCDARRIAIRGGSASGMTALLAVATSDVFRAATSLYGVMDVLLLAAETHKFEARYVDRLIGPLPDASERYRERSPIAHVGTIDADVLLLQGLDDKVVPPDQATSMRDALAARGVRVVFEAFADEGHGFRRAATRERVAALELEFYRTAFART